MYLHAKCFLVTWGHLLTWERVLNYSSKGMVGILSDTRGTGIWLHYGKFSKHAFLFFVSYWCCKVKFDLVKEMEIIGTRIWLAFYTRKLSSMVGRILQKKLRHPWVLPQEVLTYWIPLLQNESSRCTLHIHYYIKTSIPAGFNRSKMIYYTN